MIGKERDGHAATSLFQAFKDQQKAARGASRLDCAELRPSFLSRVAFTLFATNLTPGTGYAATRLCPGSSGFFVNPMHMKK